MSLQPETMLERTMPLNGTNSYEKQELRKRLPENRSTSDDSALRFFVIGDWGETTPMLQRTVKAMAERATQAPIQFVMSVGDNFYPCGVRNTQDEQFLTKWADVFLRHQSLCVPWHVCLGNHDYDGNPKAQIDFTWSERNSGGYWQCPAENHEFSYPLPGGGHAEFFALDTNGCQYCVQRSYPKLFTEMKTNMGVLSDKLSESRATWKIVFGHHPAYTHGQRHHGESRCLREECGLDEVLTSRGVNAYFCGHEHAFQHHHVQGVDHFGCGASGADYCGFYRGLSKIPAPVGWADQDLNAGFVEVSLTKYTMLVSFISADGAVIRTVEQHLVED
jgi:hypothetical protein